MIPVRDSIPRRSAPIAMWIVIGVNAAVFFFEMSLPEEQLGSRPAASLPRVVCDQPVAEVEDETLILADQAEKAVTQVRETVRELIEDLYSQPTKKAPSGKYLRERYPREVKETP